jgi:hypothetical protein
MSQISDGKQHPKKHTILMFFVGNGSIGASDYAPHVTRIIHYLSLLVLNVGRWGAGGCWMIIDS